MNSFKKILSNVILNKNGKFLLSRLGLRDGHGVFSKMRLSTSGIRQKERLDQPEYPTDKNVVSGVNRNQKLTKLNMALVLLVALYVTYVIVERNLAKRKEQYKHKLK